ncbi:hypothetical protein CSB09_02505 [Candidatus Gracilibacteria bacterium]|nr:MAG: hypothetical protein CSB09_02505 [Candidatus Gracilibacteria bacterium]
MSRVIGSVTKDGGPRRNHLTGGTAHPLQIPALLFKSKKKGFFICNNHCAVEYELEILFEHTPLIPLTEGEKCNHRISGVQLKTLSE